MQSQLWFSPLVTICITNTDTYTRIPFLQAHVYIACTCCLGFMSLHAGLGLGPSLLYSIVYFYIAIAILLSSAQKSNLFPQSYAHNYCNCATAVYSIMLCCS